MKKFIAFCLLAVNIAVTAFAAEIPYLDKIDPEYRKAAETYMFNYTSDADLAKVPLMQQTSAPGRETITAPANGASPAVTMYVYRPQNSGDKLLPVIYYSHGGGYLFRRSLDNTARYQNLADGTGAAVITVDYRLSTEAPFPAALTDAYNGLLYVKQNAQSLGLDGSSIVIMGDSAGGGLSAALALYNRDNANIPLKGQVLIYPMLDYRTGTEASPYNAPYNGYVCWNRPTNVFAWEKLRGGQNLGGTQLGYFSPAMAEDLTNLPPALIYVGALDLFANEDIAYAGKLVEDGNAAAVYVVPGLYHAFDNAVPQAAATQTFWQRVYDFTAQKLAQ